MPPSAPLYLDWTFWAVVVSLIAIVLSQLPPIYILLRPRRLEVAVHSRMQVTHQIGNPYIAPFVTIENTGGRKLRVRNLLIQIWRDGTPLKPLSAQNYWETQSSQSTVLFVPFSLKPGDDWSHPVAFFDIFDRQTEKSYRENQAELNADIGRKIAARPPGDSQDVIAEPALTAPFFALFDKFFVWEPGEYVFTLTVHADPGSASYEKKYRFTLYESDTAELKKLTEYYKFGGGISYNVPQHVGVFVPLSEHVA